jgi:hypothetical protein
MTPMASPTSALSAQDYHFSRNSSHSSPSTYVSPQQYSICTCGAPPNKAYLEPIIGCANKCRPKWFHLRCVGLSHFPYDNAPWNCPSCQIGRGIQYDTHRICICDVGPYEFGPTVECAKRDGCATRWFHLPCIGVYDARVETGEWHCSDCVADLFLEQKQEYEQEQEVRHSQMEQQSGDVTIDLTGDHEMSNPDEEFELEEWALDGLPGTFLGEEADPRSQSSELDLQAPTSVALDLEMAEGEPSVELPLQKEEGTVEHISIASSTPRAHSAPAQLEFWVDAAEPRDSPPVSRESSPQPSHQVTSQESRQPTPQASPESEVTAPAEEDLSIVLPDAGEEVTVNLSGVDGEDTPDNVLPTIEDAPTILPATDSDAPTQEEDHEAEAPIEEAESDDEAAQKEQQEQPMCRPECTINDDTGPMVACDGYCSGQWYHYGCVGLTVKPKSTREWFCPECRVERRNAKKRATQQGQSSNATALQPANLPFQQAPLQGQSTSSRPSRSKRATWRTPQFDTEPEYCTCGTPADNEMIACDGHCAKEWFHFACVGLAAENVPEGEWYCDECQVEQERKNKSKNARREKKKAVRRKAQK